MRTSFGGCFLGTTPMHGSHERDEDEMPESSRCANPNTPSFFYVNVHNSVVLTKYRLLAGGEESKQLMDKW